MATLGIGERLFGRAEAISVHDLSVRAVATLKHSSLARALVWPAMTAQFARRDRQYLHSADSARVRALAGTHVGQRCFVIGNGPSLTTDDLEALAGEVTFGSNRIYALFGKTSWRPTYYVAVDREFIAQEAASIPEMGLAEAFVNLTPASSALRDTPRVTMLNKRPRYYSVHKYTTDNIFYSREPWRCVAEGYTVTYTCLQLALYMGFSDIYLIGMDHTYTHWVDGEGRLHVQEGVEDHCYDDPVGALINPQYKEGVEFAYRVARYHAEDRGVRIVNATRGGALEVFEREDLDDVLARIAAEIGRGGAAHKLGLATARPAAGWGASTARRQPARPAAHRTSTKAVAR